MRRQYEVFETPEVLAKYATAAAELLEALAGAYAVLRSDPTNAAGGLPITYDQGDFLYTVETPGGGLYYLAYQVIPEPRRVLVFDLVTFRESGSGS